MNSATYLGLQKPLPKDSMHTTEISNRSLTGHRIISPFSNIHKPVLNVFFQEN